MTERFKRFLTIILEHEGGYVNDPDDPGGTTKYGISLRFLRSLGRMGDVDHDGDVDADDIRALTVETVRPFYYDQFWKPLRADWVNHEELALQLFDFCVNAGVGAASKLIQGLVKVKQDGIIGPLTIYEINHSNLCELSQAFFDARISFYEGLVVRNPKLGKFLKGWKNRALHCTSVLTK